MLSNVAWQSNRLSTLITQQWGLISPTVDNLIASNDDNSITVAPSIILSKHGRLIETPERTLNPQQGSTLFIAIYETGEHPAQYEQATSVEQIGARKPPIETIEIATTIDDTYTITAPILSTQAIPELTADTIAVECKLIEAIKNQPKVPFKNILAHFWEYATLHPTLIIDHTKHLCTTALNIKAFSLGSDHTMSQDLETKYEQLAREAQTCINAPTASNVRQHLKTYGEFIEQLIVHTNSMPEEKPEAPPPQKNDDIAISPAHQTELSDTFDIGNITHATNAELHFDKNLVTHLRGYTFALHGDLTVTRHNDHNIVTIPVNDINTNDTLILTYRQNKPENERVTLQIAYN